MAIIIQALLYADRLIEGNQQTRSGKPLPVAAHTGMNANCKEQSNLLRPRV